MDLFANLLHISSRSQALGAGTWADLLGITFQLPSQGGLCFDEVCWTFVHDADVSSHHVGLWRDQRDSWVVSFFGGQLDTS